MSYICYIDLDNTQIFLHIQEYGIQLMYQRHNQTISLKLKVILIALVLDSLRYIFLALGVLISSFRVNGFAKKFVRNNYDPTGGSVSAVSTVSRELVEKIH